MDKIFTGILHSDKPAELKKFFIERIVEAGDQPQPMDIIKSMLETCINVVIEDENRMHSESTIRVFVNWAKNNIATFEAFFTNSILLSLLDSKNKNSTDSIVLLIESLKILQKSEQLFQRLLTVIEAKSISFVRECNDLDRLHIFCVLLQEYPQCVPKGDFASRFCIAVIRCLSELRMPLEDAGKIFIKVDEITKFLASIWNQVGFDALLKSLQTIFKIISTDEDDPSLALASLVQNIPIDMIDDSIKAVLNNGDKNKKDMNLKVALFRMIDWLRWVTAPNVHLWLLAYLKGLASIKKYSILIDVTLAKVEQVFQLLVFPVVRNGAMLVLCHMLLSFQHCPKAFHKIVTGIPNVIKTLENDGEASKDCLLKLVDLVYTMIYLHAGFPDLYDPVLTVIKDYPQPSFSSIKQNLTVSHWAALSDSSASVNVEQKSETGKTGLVNLGNTCYANSVLQALYMCDSFRKSVLQQPICRFQPLLIKLQRVFAFLTLTQRAAYTPNSFLTGSRPSWFVAGHQQDCSEYLKYFLDQLHEQESLKLKQQHTKDGEATINTELTLETLIHNHFAGNVCNNYRCKHCEMDSSRTESFIDLPLAIPVREAENGETSTEKEAIELDDLINYYLEPETLDGDNKYFCENCKNLQDAERTVKITTSPQVLVLNLLRFSYNMKNHSRSKIFTDVTYPKTLSLPVSERTTPKGKRKHAEDDEKMVLKTYGLFAVIVHSGVSSESGHYYCYARHCIQGTSTEQSSKSSVDYLQDKWYLFNDSRVSYSNYESFSGVTKRFARDTAYVLLYKQLDVDAVEAANLNESFQPLVLDGPLRQDLREAVSKDNHDFLLEQEKTRKRRESMSESNGPSSYFRWDDEHDDSTPPGSCGGGGGFGGLNNSGPRFVC